MKILLSAFLFALHLSFLFYGFHYGALVLALVLPAAYVEYLSEEKELKVTIDPHVEYYDTVEDEFEDNAQAAKALLEELDEPLSQLTLTRRINVTSADS